MSIQRLSLRNVGQMGYADIEFGDLTVLVGQQATGKTVFLEMLKLVADTGYIHSELTKHGFDWKGDRAAFLSIFLGEGMQTVWTPESSMDVDGEEVDVNTYVRRHRRTKENYVFYIPAQRVLTLANGWPRPFQGYGAEDPFVVRDFSERFRVLMDKEFSRGGALFPQTNRLKNEYRRLLKSHVFGDFELRIDTHGAQKRLILQQASQSSSIPFMAWSAGQREFVPLLLGLYWLLPAAKISKRDKLEWVIIEEVEMGLHPSAISTVILLALELLSRGYRVCLSTHSPHVLDVMWALRVIKEHGANPESLLDIFESRRTPQTRSVADSVLQKTIKVFYFDRKTRETRDISNLDPGSSDPIEAGWGGLTEFSGHVADIVAKTVAASR